MKILFFLTFLSFSGVCILFSQNKPVFFVGFNSSQGYDDNALYSFYQESITDSYYLGIKQKIGKNVLFYNKTTFIMNTDQKITSKMADLRVYKLTDYLSLSVNLNEKSSFKFYTLPQFDLGTGKVTFKTNNIIEYKLKLTGFQFRTYYKNNLNMIENEPVKHNIVSCFYWTVKNMEFIKFKSGVSIYIQNNLDSAKYILPVYKSSINFEMAIDFNKLKFDEVFENNEDFDEMQ